MTETHAGALVIGEALVDVFERGNVGKEVNGGSAANTALALGRLGRPVRLATALGADHRGDGLRDWLTASNVDVVSTPIARTSTARATLAPDGSATYTFDVNWDVELSGVEPAAVVHTGSLAAALDPGATVVEGYLRAARAIATISVDPNVRPSLLGEDERRRIERILALADVIKMSDEDLAWLRPGISPEAAATRWLDGGAAVVVVTRGVRGALGFARSGTVEIDSVPVVVVDTVAAGDTFTATLLGGLLAEELSGADRRDHLQRVDAEVLARVLQMAARAAAITVSRRGANPPTRSELGESTPRAAADSEAR